MDCDRDHYFPCSSKEYCAIWKAHDDEMGATDQQQGRLDHHGIACPLVFFLVFLNRDKPSNNRTLDLSRFLGLSLCEPDIDLSFPVKNPR